MTPSEVSLQLDVQRVAKPGLSKQFTFKEQNSEHEQSYHSREEAERDELT